MYHLYNISLYTYVYDIYMVLCFIMYICSFLYLFACIYFIRFFETQQKYILYLQCPNLTAFICAVVHLVPKSHRLGWRHVFHAFRVHYDPVGVISPTTKQKPKIFL